jgi:molybdenum cofactor biosynthesis protein B
MQIDVIIASTSRYEEFGGARAPKEARDLSGEIIVRAIEEVGLQASYQLLADGIEPIRNAVLKSRGDAIVICGGTGLSPRDLTLEAVEPLFEKTLPGFGEIFRQQSLQEVGTRAMLTRAAAGVFQKKPIFCLPGSPNAAKLGIDLILAEMEHIIKHISECEEKI